MKLSTLCSAVLTVAIASASWIAKATEVSIELPPETATFKATDGVQLAQTFCVQCHSSEYVAMQPPMKRAFWEAEVTKMREKYFAVTPKEMDAKIVDYLVKAYGVTE